MKPRSVLIWNLVGVLAVLTIGLGIASVETISSRNHEITQLKAQVKECTTAAKLWKSTSLEISLSVTEYLDSYPYADLNLDMANLLVDQAKARKCKL